MVGDAVQCSPQAGCKHEDAKVMTGFGSAGRAGGVVEDERRDTFGAVYTVKFSGCRRLTQQGPPSCSVSTSSRCHASPAASSAASAKPSWNW